MIPPLLYLLLSMLGGVLYLLSGMYGEGEPTMNNEEKRILGSILDKGHVVCKDGVHLYKSGDGYVILYFDVKGNMKRDEEESFPDREDAISKYIQKTEKK